MHRMSNLATDHCGDALHTLSSLVQTCRFSSQDYANASASLSQQGVKNQGSEHILKNMLNVWGIGFDPAVSEDNDGYRVWVYDSITFLTRNPCIIGFMMKHDENEWRAVRAANDTWEWQLGKMEYEDIEKHTIIDRIIQNNCPTYILWKQWMPIAQWVNSDQPFHIRNENTETAVRWEYEPTSCWLPQRMCYDGKDKLVTRLLKKWATPCLLSNGRQFLTLAPGATGWKSDTVMEFDGLPLGTVADRLSGLVTEQLEAYMTRCPEKRKEIMPYLAHALMSVATRFGIKIHHKSLSAFGDDEFTKELQAYEEAFLKSV